MYNQVNNNNESINEEGAIVPHNNAGFSCEHHVGTQGTSSCAEYLAHDANTTAYTARNLLKSMLKQHITLHGGVKPSDKKGGEYFYQHLQALHGDANYPQETTPPPVTPTNNEGLLYSMKHENGEHRHQLFIHPRRFFNILFPRTSGVVALEGNMPNNILETGTPTWNMEPQLHHEGVCKRRTSNDWTCARASYKRNSWISAHSTATTIILWIHRHVTSYNWGKKFTQFTHSPFVIQ